MRPRHQHQPSLTTTFKSTLKPLSLTTAVRGYVEMLKEPGVVAASASFFFLFIAMSLFVVYLPAWLERGVGAQPTEIAVLFLLGGIGNALAAPQVGKISDRVGRRAAADDY